MNIKKAKNDYKEQKISKGNFIDKMHEFHKVLFDFSENLAIINPIIIPTTPTNAGIIIWSIILICLNKSSGP